MQAYKVVETRFTVGAGEVVGLSEAQMNLRDGRVDKVSEMDGVFFCRPRSPLDFKRGEIVVLPGPPAGRAAAMAVEPIGEPSPHGDIPAPAAAPPVKARRRAAAAGRKPAAPAVPSEPAFQASDMGLGAPETAQEA